MARKIIFFLCFGIAVGFLCLKSSNAEEGTDRVLELQSGLYHTVQEGDTLWDLSVRFFDTPWVWPDLWQKNRHIKNPHWLEPGERIRIFGLKGAETIREARPTPPVSRPVEAPPVETPVETPDLPYYLYPAIDSVGFIKEKPLTPRGSIAKVKGDKLMISTGDPVYIRPIGGIDFATGDRFAVFRIVKRLKDRDTKAVIGFQHYIVGVVEMVEVAPEFCVARVVRSFGDIELNDLLMPYEERSPRITLTESKKGLKGRIIISEEHQAIFADHAIVFIDKGDKDGVKIGQSYSIYYQDKERIDPKAKAVLLSPVDFGRLLVLHTEETTATALVTMAEKAVKSWATIHAVQ
ncbi:MAG: LysM peptidoglycan-binding domain-containing protein [Desulfobacterales bacterium]|nr:LysM peptidoglycan-binding domain-containing protein [Desulfobacterales bacterium]